MDLEKLEEEQEAFDAELPGMLMKHAGEFVVVRHGSIAGFYSTYSAAYEDALRRFGLDEVFLVSEVKKRPPEPISLSWQTGVMFSSGSFHGLEVEGCCSELRVARVSPRIYRRSRYG